MKRRGTPASWAAVVVWLACLCGAAAESANALTTWYLSARGNDDNDGVSVSSAWKTIARLNRARLRPGDVVAFQSGGVFAGMITAQVPDVTYTTYGGNARAVIDGAVKPGRWSIHRGRIYKTPMQQDVKNVFAGGVQMTLARYPNAGMLIVTSTNGTTELTAPGLMQPSGYWKDGQIRVRSTNYTYETRSVARSEPGRLMLEPHAKAYPANFSYGITQGYGFYLDNTLDALDAPGEWYYDRASKTLYFYAPEGADPNTLAIDASVQPYGLVSRQGSLRITALEFRHQAVSGLRFEGRTRGTVIARAVVRDAMVNGIEIAGAASAYTIDGCRIERVNGSGILIESAAGTAITSTVIRHIGLVPGYGIDNEHGMIGIALLAGSNNAIRACTVDSTGYTGIRTDGSANRVEGCTITNVMLKLSDGGALYAYNENEQTYATVWKNNVIRNAVGNIEGTTAVEPEAHGMYWDFRCRDMTAEGNTVEGTTSSGLFMQYACYKNTIRGNTFYGCSGNPIHIYTDTKYTYGGHTIAGNIFHAEGRLASMYLQFADARILDIGRFDSNYYSTGAENPAVKRVYKAEKWKSQDYSLADWQRVAGQDRHSKEIYRQPASFFARFKRK